MLFKTVKSVRLERGRVLMKKKGDKYAGYVFLLPWLIGFIGLTLIPMGMSLYYSFTNYNLLSAPQFVGLTNYIKMFTSDYHFLNALKVTFIYVFASVPLQLLASLVLAFILNKGVKGLSLFRAAFYVPSLLGGKRGNFHSVETDFWNERYIESAAECVGDRINNKLGGESQYGGMDADRTQGMAVWFPDDYFSGGN